MTEKEIIYELVRYANHEDDCKKSRYYPSMGRPTEDGGYEQYIAGKWYQVSPIDKSPKVKCDCGLDKIIKQIK